MSFLVLDRLAKSFGNQLVLRELSLAVSQGEVLALLGPSGSGKTTALRLIAGFERPDSGRIEAGGEDVTPLPVERRRFGMVFQHYALFPHLTVRENVAFGLQTQEVKLGREEIARRVDAALQAVDLPGYGERRIGEISGGQQQRVAVARALAPEPRVLLLDEPLSNLDPTLRERTRRELKRTIGRIGITTVLVTHEQEEAFHLGDRVAVLHGGRLHQVGAPADLYERPATRFVATFIGRASALPALLAGTGEALLDVPGLTTGVRWPARLAGAATGVIGASGVNGASAGEEGRFDLIVRPEALHFATPGETGSLPGRVAEIRYGGIASTFLVEVAPELELEVLAPSNAATIGENVAVVPKPGTLAPWLFAVDGPA